MMGGNQLSFAVAIGEGIAVRGDWTGARGDTGRPVPIIRLFLLFLLPTAMFKPRLAATVDARDR